MALGSITDTGREFSSTLCSRAALSSPSVLSNGYREPFPRGKVRPERVAVLWLRMRNEWELYISLRLSAYMTRSGIALLLHV